MAADGVPFVKGHGTENDFVLLPDVHGRLELTPRLVVAICDRRAGIGADGVLRVVRSESAGCDEVGDAEWFMDYRNADGSIAEMCGNGVRVYARYLVSAGLVEPGRLRLATRGGIREVEVGETGDVTVDMGAPVPVEVVASLAGRPATAVSMGNPHLVAEIDDAATLRALDLSSRPAFEPAAAFPDGVNCEFIHLDGERSLSMRVHERGVGETRSCGTGVCAAAYVASRGRPGRWTVRVPGGELSVDLDGRTARLTGPAVLVADGVLDPEWLTSVG